jgi:hypothetical protein
VLFVEAGSSFAETAGPGEAEFRMLRRLAQGAAAGGRRAARPRLPRAGPRARRPSGS